MEAVPEEMQDRQDQHPEADGAHGQAGLVAPIQDGVDVLLTGLVVHAHPQPAGRPVDEGEEGVIEPESDGEGEVQRVPRTVVDEDVDEAGHAVEAVEEHVQEQHPVGLKVVGLDQDYTGKKKNYFKGIIKRARKYVFGKEKLHVIR